MVNGRNKGAAFEREVAKMLLDDLGMKFKRDIEQYREADHGDLICEDPDFPFTLELKRYKEGSLHKPAWWQQCVTAAKAQRKIPALVYKYDRQPIRCVVHISAVMGDLTDPYGDDTVTMSWDTFMYFIREMI